MGANMLTLALSMPSCYDKEGNEYKRIYACSEPQNNCWFLIIDIVDIQNVIDIKQYVNKCVYIYI